MTVYDAGFGVARFGESFFSSAQTSEAITFTEDESNVSVSYSLSNALSFVEYYNSLSLSHSLSDSVVLMDTAFAYFPLFASDSLTLNEANNLSLDYGLSNSLVFSELFKTETELSLSNSMTLSDDSTKLTVGIPVLDSFGFGELFGTAYLLSAQDYLTLSDAVTHFSGFYIQENISLGESYGLTLEIEKSETLVLNEVTPDLFIHCPILETIIFDEYVLAPFTIYVHEHFFATDSSPVVDSFVSALDSMVLSDSVAQFGFGLSESISFSDSSSYSKENRFIVEIYNSRILEADLFRYY